MHPGGDKKLFTSESVMIFCRKSKGILLVTGEKAVNNVNELCKLICIGSNGRNPQGFLSNKSVDIYHDIDDLKCASWPTVKQFSRYSTLFIYLFIYKLCQIWPVVPTELIAPLTGYLDLNLTIFTRLFVVLRKIIG